MSSQYPMVIIFPFRRGFVLPILLFLLVACTDGKERPFLVAQICVQDKVGMNKLIDEMKTVARVKSMTFVDNSADTQRDLKAVGYLGRERTDVSSVFNVAAERNDGLGVSATNLGLPGFQIALSFAEGADRGETTRFTNDVIANLERYWVVERLPAGVGALPKLGCR